MYYELKTLMYHSLSKIDFHQGWVNCSTTCILIGSAVVAQCIKVVAPHAGSWAFNYQRQHTKLSKHIVTVTVPQLNVSNRCEYHVSSKTTIKKGCPVLLGHLCQVYVKFCDLLAGYGEVFIWIINARVLGRVTHKNTKHTLISLLTYILIQNKHIFHC